MLGLVVSSLSVLYTAEQLTLEIKDLPSAPAVPWKQFSGYLPIPGRGELFYWFVESQSAPATDPVLLWTNGGPGCSGLTGFLTEHGPFRPTEGGQLELNPYAWNRHASMFYIEQPVGVGFSVADGALKYTDADAASDNHALIKGFFKQFPQFAANAFYITSESYGGHYMPTLAEKIVVAGGVPNFRGFLVGNPITWLAYRNYGEFATYYGHQLLPKPLWDEYVEAGCRGKPGMAPGAQCELIEDKMSMLTDGLDPYALDFPKCNDSALASGRHERWTMRRALGRDRASHAVGAAGGAYPYFPAKYEPCDADWATAYLSRKDVQRAVHAKPRGPTWTGNWSACNEAVGDAYSGDDVAAPMMPVYARLFGRGLKMLIMSGDDDTVCATRGTQQFIWELGRKVVSEWAPWRMDDGPGCDQTPKGQACSQVAGYAVQFDGLSLVTVHGAGHLVPATRPAQGLEVLRRFLNDTW